MSQEDNKQDVEKMEGTAPPGGDDFQDVFDAAVEAAAAETGEKPAAGEPQKPELDTDADGNKIQQEGQQQESGQESRADEGAQEQQPKRDESQAASPDPMEALRAENAELMKRLEALESAAQARAAEQSSSQQQQQEEEQLPEELQALYEDFPTLRRAVQYEAERMVKQAGMGGGVDPELQRRIDVMDFTNSVCFGFVGQDGKFVEGVPDAIKITSDKEYWDWYGKKGYQPGSPADAIRILNEYKTERLRTASNDLSERHRGKADTVMEAMGGTIEAGNQRRGNGVAGSARKATDFDGAFEEAVSQ